MSRHKYDLDHNGVTRADSYACYKYWSAKPDQQAAPLAGNALPLLIMAADVDMRSSTMRWAQAPECTRYKPTTEAQPGSVVNYPDPCDRQALRTMQSDWHAVRVGGCATRKPIAGEHPRAPSLGH